MPYPAAILAHGATQHPDRIVTLAPRPVIPAFDGRGGKTGVATGHRVRPRFGGQGADRRGEFAARRRSAQERAHYGKTEARPDVWGVRLSAVVIRSPQKKLESDSETTLDCPAPMRRGHPLRAAKTHQKTSLCKPPVTVIGDRKQSSFLQPR